MKILVATQIFYLISTYMLRNETIFPLLMFGVSMYNQFLELCRHLEIVLLQIQFVTKPEFFLRIRPHLTKLWQKLQCLGFFWFTVYIQGGQKKRSHGFSGPTKYGCKYRKPWAIFTKFSVRVQGPIVYTSAKYYPFRSSWPNSVAYLIDQFSNSL